MENIASKSVFSKSGLATLSDLGSPECISIFHELELEQTGFLSHEAEFRSEDYKWPRDPLHSWSRIWEYPYVYFHITNYLEKIRQNTLNPVVADIGSGVTFFPFSLAKIGCDVICADIDPICRKDISKIVELMPPRPGSVQFRLVEEKGLPFADQECDLVYSISVLEHIPDFVSTVREMSRVLKPNGILILTCDIDLDPKGESQLDIEDLGRLNEVIDENFALLVSERTAHPLDVLTSRNSQYAYRRSTLLLCWDFIKQKLIKPVLGRAPGVVHFFGPKPIAVLGLVLKKRAGN